jgi:hypothetical protein
VIKLLLYVALLMACSAAVAGGSAGDNQLLSLEVAKLQTSPNWRTESPYVKYAIETKTACTNPHTMLAARQIIAVRYAVSVGDVAITSTSSPTPTWLQACIYSASVGGIAINGYQVDATMSNTYPDVIVQITDGVNG